jgi:RNA polymerase sigma-70 factor, ECF subfamily
MDEATSDESLMCRYRDGDAPAFETLYARHRAPLYRYLLRQCRVAAVAEELFQDVWMNVIRARGQYEVRARFTTWLYRLAHHCLIDHYRRQRHGVPLSYGDDPDDDPIAQVAADERTTPDNELDRRRQANRLLELIAELPEAQREAFLLREEAGLSLEAIAEATCVNAETAKSRLRYAVAKLRQGMNRNTP